MKYVVKGGAESMGYHYCFCSSDVVNGTRDSVQGGGVSKEGGMEGCCSWVYLALPTTIKCLWSVLLL